MSDIPSALSKWEPPRSLKVAFLWSVVLSFAALFGAKLYTSYIENPRKVELALRAERGHGPAPTFTLKDRSGKTVSLSDYRGKIVFVHFWATWCAPCREELPTVAEYARELDPNDVVFLAVSADDSWADVDSYYQQQQQQLGPLQFTTLLDVDKKVSEAYGTTGYPESYIVGRNGELLYKFVGGRDWSSIAAIKLLENAGVHRLPQPPSAMAKSS